MCIVKEINACEKKIVITLNDQRVIESDWFEDDNKNREARATNRTIGETKVYNNILKEEGLSINDVDYWIIRRKRENDIVYISEHGMQRLKDRNGWNRKTSLRMMKRVFDNGLRMNELSKNVRKWLVGQLEETGRGYYFIVYGQFAYLFNYNTLVTLIHIPVQINR